MAACAASPTCCQHLQELRANPQGPRFPPVVSASAQDLEMVLLPLGDTAKNMNCGFHAVGPAPEVWVSLLIPLFRMFVELSKLDDNLQNQGL